MDLTLNKRLEGIDYIFFNNNVIGNNLRLDKLNRVHLCPNQSHDWSIVDIVE